MKQLLSYSIVMLLAAGCSKADKRPVNTDNTIAALWITIPGADEAASRSNAVFNTAGDTAFVTVPQRFPNTAAGKSVTLDSLRVRASVGVGAIITPGLGLMNLRQPVKLTVTSGTKEIRTYWLVAKQ